MNEQEEKLYDLYANWTNALHRYCQTHLGQDLDVEFFPADWEMRLYAGGTLEVKISKSGIPGLVRPRDARPFRLPRPENDPSPEELNQAFRALCYAAAVVLKIDVSKAKLEDGHSAGSDPTALLSLDDL